jgi:hypothetical protein
MPSDYFADIYIAILQVLNAEIGRDCAAYQTPGSLRGSFLNFRILG